MYNKIILIARFYVLVERNTSLLLPIKQVREGINFHRSNFEAKKKLSSGPSLSRYIYTTADRGDLIPRAYVNETKAETKAARRVYASCKTSVISHYTPSDSPRVIISQRAYPWPEGRGRGHVARVWVQCRISQKKE